MCLFPLKSTCNQIFLLNPTCDTFRSTFRVKFVLDILSDDYTKEKYKLENPNFSHVTINQQQ